MDSEECVAVATAVGADTVLEGLTVVNVTHVPSDVVSSGGLGPCPLPMDAIRAGAMQTDCQLLSIGMQSAQDLKANHAVTTSSRCSVGGGTMEISIKYRAFNKRPAPRVEGFKVEGRNVGKFFMQSKLGDKTRVYVPADEQKTKKAVAGALYSLICNVPMLKSATAVNGQVSMSFPKLSTKGGSRAEEYHGIDTVASIKNYDKANVLCVSLSKPVLLGVEGDDTSVMLYNPEIMGSKTGSDKQDKDKYNTKLNPCVCTLSAYPDIVRDVYAHAYKVISEPDFLETYICDAVRSFEGRAVPATIEKVVPFNVLMTRLCQQSYTHDGNASEESPLLLSVETLADFLVLSRCDKQWYHTKQLKKDFIDAASGQGVKFDVDDAIENMDFYSFKFLYLETETRKLNTVSGVEPFVDPLRDEDQVASILQKHPFCPYLHHWNKQVTHVVTGSELRRFFSKKPPTFGALCSWIMGKTVAVDETKDGRVIAKSTAPYIPGSCQDTGLRLEGIRFDTSMSWLANEYTDPEIVQSPLYWATLNAAALGMTERLCELVEWANEARLLKSGSNAPRVLKYDRKFPLLVDLPIDDPVSFDVIRGEMCMVSSFGNDVVKEWNQVGLGSFNPDCFAPDTSSNMDMLVYVFVNLVVRCAGMGSKSEDGPSLLDAKFIKCWGVDDIVRGADVHAVMGARWSYSALLSNVICFLLRNFFASPELFACFPIVLPKSGFDIDGRESARRVLAKYILGKWVGNKTVNTYSFPFAPLNELNDGCIKMALVVVQCMTKTPRMTHGQAVARVGAMTAGDLAVQVDSVMEELRHLASQRIQPDTGANETPILQRYNNDADDDLTFEQVQMGLEFDCDPAEPFVFKGEHFTFVKGGGKRKRQSRKKSDGSEGEDSSEEEEGGDEIRKPSVRIAEKKAKNTEATPAKYDFGDGDNDEDAPKEGDSEAVLEEKKKRRDQRVAKAALATAGDLALAHKEDAAAGATYDPKHPVV